MAQGYRADGDVRAAMELYWLLVEEHQETRQAATAKEVLLEMAEGYERRRAPFMARSIYDRLLTDETACLSGRPFTIAQAIEQALESRPDGSVRTTRMRNGG